jgi:hypothetical protein
MQPPDRKSAPTPKGTCRVWIIEDHLSIRQLLESFVGLIPGFTVAGSSPAAEPAVEAARAGGSMSSCLTS